MLWELVNSFLGSIPEEYDFIKIFGVLFIMYIVLQLFNMLYESIRQLLRGL